MIICIAARRTDPLPELSDKEENKAWDNDKSVSDRKKNRYGTAAYFNYF